MSPTDGRTDRQMDKVILVYTHPPPTSLGRGIMRSLKINRLLPILYMYISILPLKFGVDIQSQTKVSPETKKSNIAARRPFWKWSHWKSIGFYPYIQVLCHLSLELIFSAKLKIESENQKIQYGCLAAILKLTLLKINRLLHIYIKVLWYLSLELIFKPNWS